MPHVSRLTRELRSLLHSQRVAALGTVGEDGAAFVSMVPYALEQDLGCLVIHVSGLAVHTRNLLARPRVSLMVMKPEVHGAPVHALARVTLDGVAAVPEPASDAWTRCRDAYLRRFPEAEPMTQLADFRFVRIEPSGARQVAGFGSARSIDAREVRLALAPAR